MGAPKPSLVSLTGGRGRMIYKGTYAPNVHIYHVCDRDKDAALIAAYEKEVGRPPNNNVAPSVREQFMHSPHKRNRRRVIADALPGGLCG